MKFLCLCHFDAAGFAKLTPADFQEIATICEPHDKALRESGQVDAVGSLGMPYETKVLRCDATGSVAVDGGPYAEQAEPIGAFFLVEAEDMDGAVAVAKLHPGNYLGAKFGGGIEIVPVGDFWSCAK